MALLKEILHDNWEWRKQIVSLGLFDLTKQARGAALGWFWFFAKPAVYILVFWFALQVGLRSERHAGEAPYILWLMGGLIPWFYMQSMLGQGIHIFGRYSYLVNKIKFPLVGIPSIYAVSELVIHAGLVLALVIVYFVCGQGLDIHLVQLPFAILLMVVFWYLFSLTCSCLSALSKDFMNLVKTLSTPLFWLSGIIFDIFALGIGWLTTILAFNPVTFFATFYRCIFYDKIWIWELPETCFGMCVVFLVTLIAALVVYSRTKEEVHDVL